MAADRHDFVDAASGFREPTTCRLAQPVRLAALRQTGGVAPFAKALGEMVAAIWLAGRGDQKCQMLAWARVEYRLQVRMHRNCQRDAGLLLLHREHAALDMLPPHADYVGAPLCGVEQEREREARLRADGVMRLELRDLFLGPRVESIALDCARLDVGGRVGAQVAALDPELAERAQRREPTTRGVRRLGVK